MSNWLERSGSHKHLTNNQRGSHDSPYIILSEQVIDATRPPHDATGFMSNQSNTPSQRIDKRHIHGNSFVSESCNRSNQPLTGNSQLSDVQPYSITRNDWNRASISSAPDDSLSNLTSPHHSNDTRPFAHQGNHNINSQSHLNQLAAQSRYQTPTNHSPHQASMQPARQSDSHYQSQSRASEKTDSDSLIHQVIKLPSWSTNAADYMADLLKSPSINKLLTSLNLYCPTGEFDPPARELALTCAQFLKDSTLEQTSAVQGNMAAHILQHVILIVETRFNLLFQSGHLPTEMIAQMARMFTQQNQQEFLLSNQSNLFNQSPNQPVHATHSSNNQLSNSTHLPVMYSSSYPSSTTPLAGVTSMSEPSSFGDAFASHFMARSTMEQSSYQSFHQSQSIDNSASSMLNVSSNSPTQQSAQMSQSQDISHSPLPIDALEIVTPRTSSKRRQSLSPNHHSSLHPPTLPNNPSKSRKRSNEVDLPAQPSTISRASSASPIESGTGNYKVQRIEDRWSCPNIGCNKYYRPTSGASIRAHILSCKYRPVDQIVDARLTDRRRKAVNEKEEETRLELPPA